VQQAVFALLVVGIVLPAVFVDAADSFTEFCILSEEEILLWQNFKTDGVSKIQEAYLLVFIEVEPVEQFTDSTLLGFEAPIVYNHVELIESYVTLSVSIKLIKCLPQGFELQFDFPNEHFLQICQRTCENLSNFLLDDH
jgi:hypothetical protein